ncbi:MAG TPA: ATP-binding protein, partial [Chitinophagaceae bacterium]|nr:ATP-binding protein [Chitinophagaceae bacterium]
EISQTYVLMNELDSAKFFAEKSINEKELVRGAQWNFPVYLLATIQNLQGNHQQALEEYRHAIPLAVQNEYFHDTLQIFSGMATAFRNLGQIDSSLHYATLVERSNNPEREIKTYLEALNNLAIGYKLSGNKDSALKYLELNYAYRDSVLGKEKERAIQGITFTEKIKQQELMAAQAKYKSRLQMLILGAGLLVLLLIIGILWRNNKQKQKAKNKIEAAYSELKTTQAQHIQSEKMASLGELTAGIAHEIQNPLNFVNNFSEVNEELVAELKKEAGNGNLEEVKAIANDIAFNSEKIAHHGKRADAIVKGMLQHSRSSNGQKEPTDINSLADEYLRLAYHGLRAKDKSFNADIKTDFDNNIGKLNIIPQDIGRVVLNLINNAFYAVDEKKKENQNGYEPTVSVSTKKEKDKVEIRVKDNGNGIPQNVLDKVFQPFFTTKPTGQGTGLGLSLSYDIVKAHGGELKVKTKEGEGSEFIIQLPTSKTA